MPDIFDRLAQQAQPQLKKGDIFDRLASEQRPERSVSGVKRFAKGLARQRIQPLLGAAERVTFPAELIEPASREVLREVAEGDEFLIPEVAEAARQQARSFVPTQRELEAKIEGATGLPLSPETSQDELARLIGAIGRVPKPGPEKIRPIKPQAKATAPKAQVVEAIPEFEIERLPSGLTKPKAIGAQHTQKALLSPERQKKAIQSIDMEASHLAQKVVSKRLPQSEKILQGHDFEGEFADRFGQLEKAAKRANPEIDITDMTDFFTQARQKYAGIPSGLLDIEGKKILNEIKVLRDRPQLQLKNLLKLYRLNNKKRSEIYERRFLTGKQKDYVKFLGDMNRSIVKSFERTFPEDSAWLNQFKQANADYSGYIGAQKTLNQLEPVLEAKASTRAIAGLAEDPRKQKKLALAMGKEGADEIIQIAKDMKLARDAIKGIPVKDLKAMDNIYPLGVFVPGIKIPGLAAGLKKGVDFGRRIYGYFLTTPAKRQVFDEAVKAIQKGDKAAYARATTKLKEEPQKLIPFQQKKQIEFKSPFKIEKELDPLIEQVKKYPDFDKFWDAIYSPKGILDVSNRPAQRWGRMISVSTDPEVENLKQFIKKYPYSNVKPEYTEKLGKRGVIAYRAAPKNAHLEPGDWIALNEKYAQGHKGVLGREEVFSRFVPEEDIMWAGSDENEWIYAPKKLREEIKKLLPDYESIKKFHADVNRR